MRFDQFRHAFSVLVVLAITSFADKASASGLLYDSYPPVGWFLRSFGSVADDTQLGIAGPAVIQEGRVKLFGTFLSSENISLSVNFYQRVGTAATWTRGAFLGGSGPLAVQNGTDSFFDVFFDVNVATPDENLVTEIHFNQTLTGIRGASVNHTPVVGSSANRYQVDGVYYSDGGSPLRNMGVQLTGAPVPEPMTLALAGGAFVTALRRRRRA